MVVLNRLERSGGTRPTLEDIWSRRYSMEELYQLPELRSINARSWIKLSIEPIRRPRIT